MSYRIKYKIVYHVEIDDIVKHSDLKIYFSYIIKIYLIYKFKKVENYSVLYGQSTYSKRRMLSNICLFINIGFPIFLCIALVNNFYIIFMLSNFFCFKISEIEAVTNSDRGE